MREAAGTPLDPAATHGNMTAQVALAFIIDPDDPKGPVNYSINADVANFAIDRFVMSQRIEAQTLRVAANNQGYQVKGDVRIGGMLAAIDYRKLTSEPDAQFRLQASFDDAARTKFGFDLGNSISGPVPIKLAGRMGMTPIRKPLHGRSRPDASQDRQPDSGWLKAPVARAAPLHGRSRAGSRSVARTW